MRLLQRVGVNRALVQVGLVSLVVVVMSSFAVDAKTASSFDLFRGSSNVAHRPPHCRTRQLNSRLRVSVLPCTRADGRGWVVGTSARVGCGVNVGIVGERGIFCSA